MEFKGGGRLKKYDFQLRKVVICVKTLICPPPQMFCKVSATTHDIFDIIIKIYRLITLEWQFVIDKFNIKYKFYMDILHLS